MRAIMMANISGPVEDGQAVVQLELVVQVLVLRAVQVLLVLCLVRC